VSVVYAAESCTILHWTLRIKWMINISMRDIRAWCRTLGHTIISSLCVHVPQFLGIFSFPFEPHDPVVAFNIGLTLGDPEACEYVETLNRDETVRRISVSTAVGLAREKAREGERCGNQTAKREVL